MLDSKINKDGAVGSVSATGTRHRIFGAAKSMFSPIRKRTFGSVNRHAAGKVSVVPLPKAGVAPEGLRLSDDVWFYL